MPSLFKPLTELFGATASTIWSWTQHNSLLREIESRFQSLEVLKDGIEKAVASVAQVALTRINEYLGPTIEHILLIQEKGFLTAASDTQRSLVVGLDTMFVIKEEDRNFFAPSPHVAIGRTTTPDDWAIARVLSYNHENGQIVLRILTVYGDPGPHSDWSIGALPGAVLPVLDAAEIAEDAVVDVEADRAAVAADRAAVAADKTALQADKTAMIAARNDLFARYLGPLAASPGAGVNGQFYYNTTDGRLYVYGNGSWAAPVEPASYVPIRQQFVATQGQTVFTLTAGFEGVDVFVNGILLQKTEDYTVNSPSVTLLEGASAGDVVNTLAWAFRNDPPTDGYYLNTEVDALLATFQAQVNATVAAALAAKPSSAEVKAIARKNALIYG